MLSGFFSLNDIYKNKREPHTLNENIKQRFKRIRQIGVEALKQVDSEIMQLLTLPLV